MPSLGLSLGLPFGRSVTGSSPGFVGPLDAWQGVLGSGGGAGSWSVARRLFASYEGPLIKIQTMTDLSELDIYPLADGSLDVDAVMSLSPAAEGYVKVVTVYDQSGGLNHLANEVSKAPFIVLGGELCAMPGGAPCAYFPPSGECFLVCNTLSPITGGSTSGVTLFACLHDLDGNPKFGGTLSSDNIYLQYRAGGVWVAAVDNLGLSENCIGSFPNTTTRVCYKQENSVSRKWQFDGGTENPDTGGDLADEFGAYSFGVCGWFMSTGGGVESGSGKISEMLISPEYFTEADAQAVQATQAGLI